MQFSQKIIDELINSIKFNENGLIPAIAQQHDSLEVLMMAWMNKESIIETLSGGHVCYWSRSRKSLWKKGETSGNIQKLVSMRIDCDNDTLLVLVDQTGPACHTNRANCFYKEIKENSIENILDPIN
ncbi:phosphoribosyl-AMP cyclohydrolase [Rickettsiales bacterium]|nr:phosphoribosyl-AMP cyclohydrolase [Rickettsiales bacterium]